MFTRLFSKSSLIRNQFKLCTQSKYLLNKRFFYNTPKLFAEEESHEDKEIVNLVTIYQEVEEEQAKSKISMTSTNIFAGIEIEDGLEAISDRLWENYPEDELQEVMPKKLHVYMTGEGRTRAYNERVDRVDLLTHEGEVGILPGYPTTGFILEPGLIRVIILLFVNMFSSWFIMNKELNTIFHLGVLHGCFHMVQCYYFVEKFII